MTVVVVVVVVIVVVVVGSGEVAVVGRGRDTRRPTVRMRHLNVEPSS